MLSSSLFLASADLATVESGGRRMLSPETSESVGLVQQALLSIGEVLPRAGIDENFGSETGSAVSRYKVDRRLSPSDPVVGRGTIRRLDAELCYLEDKVSDPAALDTKTLALDPLMAGILEHRFGDLSLGQRVIDASNFGDKICLRASLILGPAVAAALGRFVEPLVFEDFKQKRAPSTSATDFFDVSPGSRDYTDFLIRQHPQVDPAALGALHSERRPDILSNRPPHEWYELKPQSISGSILALKKFNTIITNYARLGLPYDPGTAYTPARELRFRDILVDPVGGEQLIISIELWRAAPGLIFYVLCVRGDYVRYFNRVRLAAGLLAILVAIGVILPEALGGAVIIEAAAGLAASLNLILPVLQWRTP